MRNWRYIAVLTFFLLTLFAPEAFEHVFGFSPQETHTAFPYARPFFSDVPSSRQSFDSEKVWFNIILVHTKAETIAVDGSDGVLSALSSAYRALSMLMARTFGTAEMIEEVSVLEALKEWPMWASEVSKACKEGLCPVPALIEYSRFLRLTSQSLRRMDLDKDGLVDKAEFLGAPVTMPHILGTDGLGRDCLARLLEGFRLSMLVGLASAFAAALFGTFYGALAGSLGGTIAVLMLRFVDVLYALPFFFIVILLISIVGPSLLVLFLAIVCLQWLGMARTTYHLVCSLMEAPFVVTSRTMGASVARVIVTHVLPNARKPLLTWTVLLVPAAIKEEAFLSFLGLGVQPPRASLGTLIAEGIQSLTQAPWLVLWPALALFGLVFLVNLACEHLGAHTSRPRDLSL